MADFFALILDWELAEPIHPQVRLVATASEPEPLEAIESYDPSAPFTTINFADFTIAPDRPHPIINQFTGQLDPAHICEVQP